jgi:hypothetical protein
MQLFADVDGTPWRIGFAGYFITAPSTEALDGLITKHPSGWVVSRIAPTIASIELAGSAADIVACLKKAGHRIASDNSLDRDCPPRLLWKRIRVHSQLKELVSGPESDHIVISLGSILDIRVSAEQQEVTAADGRSP